MPNTNRWLIFISILLAVSLISVSGFTGYMLLNNKMDKDRQIAVGNATLKAEAELLNRIYTIADKEGQISIPFIRQEGNQLLTETTITLRVVP